MLKNIREHWPEHELHLVCREGLGALLKQLGLIDFYYEIKKRDSESYQKIRVQVQSIQFERIFCPHQSLRSALFVKELKSKLKIGYKNWWSFLFFDVYQPRDKNLPDALRQLSLLSQDSGKIAEKLKKYSENNSIDRLGEVPEWAKMTSTEQIPSQAGEFLGLNCVTKTIAIFPGSVWPTKQWTLEGFIQIGRFFCSQNLQVVLLGGVAEKSLAAQIEQAVPAIKNLVGQTNLIQTLSVLKNCELVISNDSGGQHLASVAEIPTLSIFGPTVLSLGYRPWNSYAQVIEVEGMPCRPCGKHGHKKCPLGTHACMKELSAEKVISAIQKLNPNLYNPSR